MRNGKRYEYKVARYMRWHGYLFVRVVGKPADYGADIIARDLLLRKVVVQCKSYSGKVGIAAVQQAIAAKAYFRASRAIVATNSTFTASAKKMADKCHVKLWERCC